MFICHIGLTALDYIVDYDEWIDCGYFGDEIKARLKGKIYIMNLKKFVFDIVKCIQSIFKWKKMAWQKKQCNFDSLKFMFMLCLSFSI